MPNNPGNRENPIEVYGAWIHEVPADWSEDALGAARNAFIDTIGVMIAGASEVPTKAVLSMTQDWADGDCVALGADRTKSPVWAALVNGTAAHALDFDDNFDPAKAHASAVLIPAILAIAEQENSSGTACLDAYIVGLQILGLVGQGLNPYHRNRGWHATSTLGAIGAAAACARLLQLDAEKSGFALSIATSMSSGSMAQFGTMTKPLHAGLGAKAGVMAALLSRSGIDAGLNVLDGPQGMQKLMVGQDFDELRDALEHVEHGQDMRFKTSDVADPLLILSSGLKLKRFPNCGSTHRAMDCMSILREEMNFTAEDIKHVRVSAPITHLNNLMYTDPETPAQAKFSLEYGLAMIALQGQCNLADFGEDAVENPAARALYKLIERNPVDKAEGEFPTLVEVELRDGRKGKKELSMPIGSKELPLTGAQVKAKFLGCVQGLLPRDKSQDLYDSLCKLDSQDTLNSISALLREVQVSSH